VSNQGVPEDLGKKQVKKFGSVLKCGGKTKGNSRCFSMEGWREILAASWNVNPSVRMEIV